jgi:hypothetical protein
MGRWIEYASETEESGGTALGLCPVPALAEIAANPEFMPEEITQDEFEEIWSARHIAQPDLLR